MPPFTGWRTDTELYPTPQADIYAGNALVSTFTEADVRAETAVTDLTDPGQFFVRTGYDQGIFGFTPLAYLYAQGFVAYDFDPLINPVDPTVTYEPQIPFDDPDTARPDWLGNVLGDPAAGVIFEEPQGTLATDQPVEITTVGFQIGGPGTLPPPAALHWWQVDPSVVWRDGLGWHAESIPANDVLTAAAAAPHHVVTPATQPFLPSSDLYDYVVDLNHEVFTFADLRTDNTLAAAASIDPSTTDDWRGVSSMTFAAGFPIAAQLRYRNPRYRLLFHSPQRQYPRDDGLAISTTRSWPPPTSRQYGTRRGPTATYW